MLYPFAKGNNSVIHMANRRNENENKNEHLKEKKMKENIFL